MDDKLIYSSKGSLKSLWSEYNIYSDKLELKSIFTNLTIPFENIESFTKAESDLEELIHGHLHLKNFKPALKLDWANFQEHLVVDKTDGIIHRILFTPDNIDEFMEALSKAVNNYRK
jgi:hypothetical protein